MRFRKIKSMTLKCDRNNNDPTVLVVLQFTEPLIFETGLVDYSPFTFWSYQDGTYWWHVTCTTYVTLILRKFLNNASHPIVQLGIFSMVLPAYEESYEKYFWILFTHRSFGGEQRTNESYQFLKAVQCVCVLETRRISTEHAIYILHQLNKQYSISNWLYFVRMRVSFFLIFRILIFKVVYVFAFRDVTCSNSAD